MTFRHKLQLLNGKEIWASEITFSQYKTIVKSIYNTDDTSFVYHTNMILQQVVASEVFLELTVIDKLVILLQLRAVCVDPDFKIKIKCDETNKEFEFTTQIDALLKKLSLKNCCKTIELNDFTIDVSLIKAKDEQYLIFPYVTETDIEKSFFHTVVSSIDTIKYKDQTVSFKDLTWEERVEFATRLPAKLSSYIINNISDAEKNISQNKLITAISPFTNKVALELPLTTNVPSLIKFIKLIFTENLGNLYTITYNLVNRGGFTGEYLDTITPIETQVYWAYCQKQIEKESEESKDETSNMSRSRSEFT